MIFRPECGEVRVLWAQLPLPAYSLECLKSRLFAAEMETGRVDRHRLPVGSGYRSGRVGIS